MKNRPVVVGIVGFGTVGTGVVRFLLDRQKTHGDLRLARVAVASLSKPREIEVPSLTDDVDRVLNDPSIDIVVELMGGTSPAFEHISTALRAGKSVVTANKAVIARRMPELFGLARDKGVDFAFEAAVAGSIPIIRILRGLGGEPIERVTGILNGTSNYVLSRMEEGLDFESAIRMAQEKGFAEADHTLDTGGFDARDKLSILASLAFNSHIAPEAVYCEGIAGITPIDLDFASKHGVEEGGPGYAVKSLATAGRDNDTGTLELHVYPALVRRDHPLASVRDEMNAVYLVGGLCGPQLYLGRGAGRNATSSAVISDLLRVARNRREGIVDELPDLAENPPLRPVSELKRRGYVRMSLKHIPGSIAETSRILGSHGFNIEDSMQRRRFRTEVDGEVFIPDIVTVEPLPFGVVGKALEELKASNRIHGEPFFLRFEG